MRRLLLFLFRYRAFLLFLFAETISSWLIVKNNKYQSAAFFNSSNSIAASILNVSNEITGYFNLRSQNEELTNQIADLRTQLEFLKKKQNQEIIVNPVDSVSYNFISAKIINNSTRNLKNHLTINKGAKQGVKPGMGVIGGGGIVGKIKYVSKNFSVVISLLHIDQLISAKIPGKVEFGSVNWDGIDPGYANLLYVPRHVQLSPGDTVFTSGYGGIYPTDLKIGVLHDIIDPEETFLNLRLKLINDFSNLNYVHLIKFQLKPELDSLETTIDLL